MAERPGRLAAFSALPEPLLTFSTEKPEAARSHPLLGLTEFGPYSAAAFAAFTPKVRIAIAGPASGRDARRDLLRSLNEAHAPTDRRDYVPPYPGFEAVFGAPLAPAPPEAQIALPETPDEAAGSRHDAVRAALASAISRLSAVRDRFDVAIFHLPDAWGPGLKGVGFDAHDELKALGAASGIPTQVVNDRLFKFDYKASRAWRLGIAMYVKAGGIPWKLAPIPGVPDGSAYIGLAYALRGDPRQAQFVTCCSQVFDADGGGIQFVAYDAHDPVEDTPAARRNPYLSRDDMRAVLARSLQLYQRRNGGRIPQRVVVHKTTAFREAELDGALDALAAVPEVDCLEITTNVAWRGVWLRASQKADRKSEPDGYPVWRGTMAPLTGTSALLWVAGNAPAAALKGNYYQGSKSIPRPLLIRRHAGRGALELPAAEVVALTKMDWNNDALYDPIPVTVRYSKVLARTIANVPSLRREVYPYRLFM